MPFEIVQLNNVFIASTIGSSAAHLGSSTSDLTNFADQNTEKVRDQTLA